MIELGSRERAQPAPPSVIWETLVEPRRSTQYHQWLTLNVDETDPNVVESSRPTLVVWSSIWLDRPNDLIRFEISNDEGGGSRLRWTLESPDESPTDERLGRLRYRINYLINGKMRQSMG
jgi:hypothetical protein